MSACARSRRTRRCCSTRSRAEATPRTPTDERSTLPSTGQLCWTTTPFRSSGASSLRSSTALVAGLQETGKKVNLRKIVEAGAGGAGADLSEDLPALDLDVGAVAGSSGRAWGVSTSSGCNSRLRSRRASLRHAHVRAGSLIAPVGHHRHTGLVKGAEVAVLGGGSNAAACAKQGG